MCQLSASLKRERQQHTRKLKINARRSKLGLSLYSRLKCLILKSSEITAGSVISTDAPSSWSAI
jgi:hypothetical protein